MELNDYEEDINEIIYNKLNFFKISDRRVFFFLKNKKFNKGKVLDLNREMRTLVLRDDKFGEMPILFEQIEAESIKFVKIHCVKCGELKEEYLPDTCEDCADGERRIEI